MNGKKGTQGRFFQCLSYLAWWIDENLRFGDLHGNRTTGGCLDKKYDICRHSYHYLLLPTLAAAIIVMGVPELGARALLAVAVAIAAFFLLKYLAKLSIEREWSVRTEMFLQVIVVLAVAVIVWFASGDKGDKYEKGILIYRHFFILIAVIICASLIVAGFFSGCMWRKLRPISNYDVALAKTELFISRDPNISLGFFSLIRSFLMVIPGAPLQLMLIPAFSILLAPPHLVYLFAIVFFMISYCIFFMGGFDSRLHQIWHVFQDIFFRGGTLLVSLIIIGLAAARIVGLSYVTTIFDTAQGIVIFLLLCSSYVIFWWYDYWVNRLLAQELIKLLNAKAVCDAQIPYPIQAGCVHTHVLQSGRVLQIHGASRFIVIGSSDKDSLPRFQAYPFEKLFEMLAVGGFPGGKAKPSPAQIAESILNYKCLAGTIMVIFSVLVGLCISFGVQEPQLKVENKIQTGLQLAQLLDEHTRNHNDQPAFIIAASGGGTRAALYTAAVMEGLKNSGRIQDVIMGSGVSGGGASLAYFAGKRPELVKSNESAWDEFFYTMSKPFIRDVIDGALEWRIVSSSRLGVLLTESFERLWNLAPNRNKLGDVQDFGLILNTAIAGQFKCDDKSKECSKLSLIETARCFRCGGELNKKCLELPFVKAECCFRNKMTRSELAGGRLILTNLLLGEDFAPNVEEVGGRKNLPVILHDKNTRLEVAAALNANFPPVFSNAAIDVDDKSRSDKSRYWVTDGGAADNRGIEMLLYALRGALNDLKGLARAGGLPKVTIVVLDASAYSHKYSQDRGVGSLMGAGTQFASLLVEEQLESIRTLYKQKGQSDRFQFIYLPMPLCLRESGSFGTHWMLQPTIDIALGTQSSKTLKGEDMIALLRAMHSPGQGVTLTDNAEAVLKYAVKDERWSEGIRKLGFIYK